MFWLLAAAAAPAWAREEVLVHTFNLGAWSPLLELGSGGDHRDFN